MRAYAPSAVFAILGSCALAGGATPSMTTGNPLQKGQIWEGVYTCHAQTGARLWINETGPRVAATLEFFPLTTGQNWPYGRAKVQGTWQAGDILRLNGVQWQVQPANFDLPKVMKVEWRDNKNTVLLSFTREDSEKSGCTGARLTRLREW